MTQIEPFKLHRIIAAGLLTLGLSACVAPLMVGGFVGGTMVASDRRTSGAQLEDQGIEIRASARIREQIGTGVHINVTSYNRQVLLTGEVSKAQEKQLADQILARVENVRSVVNELAVAPISSLSDRANDALISGKVKATMVDSRDVFANAYKVVTERGTVYLMGRVTQREANRAVEIARGVSGVQKIIRVFEIITEEELKTLQPPPMNDTPPSQASKP
ncbi:MAG: BON domain-containing protein [Betaproteobacteria bacterium]|nr:BON domain-containing protein [Betaproteobacteria bacterium]NBY04366.1 BON domain-containing protein [Betaproteobacteria bacterium]